jgi:hypothetical protein
LFRSYRVASEAAGVSADGLLVRAAASLASPPVGTLPPGTALWGAATRPPPDDAAEGGAPSPSRGGAASEAPPTPPRLALVDPIVGFVSLDLLEVGSVVLCHTRMASPDQQPTTTAARRFAKLSPSQKLEAVAKFSPFDEQLEAIAKRLARSAREVGSGDVRHIRTRSRLYTRGGGDAPQ